MESAGLACPVEHDSGAIASLLCRPWLAGALVPWESRISRVCSYYVTSRRDSSRPLVALQGDTSFLASPLNWSKILDLSAGMSTAVALELRKLGIGLDSGVVVLIGLLWGAFLCRC